MGRTGFRIFFASLLLAGCGSVKDSGTAIDAPVGDAGPDADESGMATVITEAALFGGTIGTNVGDIDIISMLPNNTVLEMKKTDAGGNATIKVYPGGSVTAVYKHSADVGADLITFMDVQPGDTLTFGSRNFATPPGTPNTNLGSMTYSWPAQAGAQFYDVFTSCAGQGVQAPTLTLNAAEFSLCHRDPMDVMFLVETSGVGVSHFGFRSNVTFASGGAVSNPGWQAVQQASINITGLPPEITNVSGNFSTIIDGSREFSFLGFWNGNVTGGAFTTQFSWHPTGERTLGNVFLPRSGFTTMRIVDAFAANNLTQTVAAPTLTAWLQSGVIASSALRMANWFMVPDANSVQDGVVLRLNWNHVVSAMSNPHQWHIIMPPNTQAVVLPKLPAQFEENLPAPQDGLSGQVKVFDISTINDYNGVRAQPSRNIMCTDCALRGGDFQRVVSSGNVQ